jgi:excisionase family DNA binding protein
VTTGREIGILEGLVEMIAERVAAKIAQTNRPSLMTVREAAKELRRSERWLRGEIAAGKLECVREGHSRPRITRDALERYVQQREGRG